jgi:hypothetical protein
MEQSLYKFITKVMMFVSQNIRHILHYIHLQFFNRKQNT